MGRKVGLQTDSGSGFINKTTIEKLYDAMAAFMDTFTPDAPSAHVENPNVSVPPGNWFEVMRHPDYASVITPLTMENLQNPRLARICNRVQGTNDFYPDEGDEFTHYQRYPIVADLAGGRVPHDAYFPGDHSQI